MSINLPRGVVKLPWTLTENTSGLTKTDSVANAESEIVSYQVPRKKAIAVRRGDRLYLYIATSAPAQITAGTVRVYITDATKRARKHLVYEASPDELDAGGVPEDLDKQAKFSMGFNLKEDDYLIVTYEGASVADDAQTKLRMTGAQFIQT